MRPPSALAQTSADSTRQAGNANWWHALNPAKARPSAYAARRLTTSQDNKTRRPAEPTHQRGQIGLCPVPATCMAEYG